MTSSEIRGSNDGDADLPVGEVVGEYVIAEKIGVGGFGTVYRAEHPLIGKEVAIKVLGLKLSADPEMVSRFVAEARSVNQIQSKYIIDIFGFGELEDGRQFFIMELLDGMPLDVYLDEVGCLTLAEAIPILRGIGKALDAAHTNGVAHRDLKPENVYLVRDEQLGFRPKLLDFGIAKLLGEKETMHKTRTGAPMGTPLYMSPEQCRGRGVDHRTDIYAFGCMSYQMLTGEVPFDGEGYMDILFKQIQEDPPVPSSINATLPAAVDQVLADLMAKNPDDRPVTLAQAVKSLEAAARDAGITVVSTASGEHSALSSERAFSVSTTGSKSAVGVAATVADSAQLSEPLPDTSVRTKSKLPVVIGFAALAACAAAAFFVLNSNSNADESSKENSNEQGETAANGESPSAMATLPDAATASPTGVPPEPSFVTLELSGMPDGTGVHWGAKGLIGTAPGRVQFPRGDQALSILLRADGHIAKSVEFIPDRDQELDVALASQPKAAPTSEPPRKRKAKSKERGKGSKKPKEKADGKNTIEDPF